MFFLFFCFSPHLCVCGVFVFNSVWRALLLPACLPPPPLHTHLPSTHHLCQPSLSTNNLSHTIAHNHLYQPPFHTPSFTHHLSRTSLYLRFAWQAWHLQHWAGSGSGGWHHFVTHTHTTIFDTPSFTHTQLCHMLSFTHNFHTHHLSHTTLSHTTSFFVTHNLSHTTLSRTHTTLFYLPVLHHILCPSFFPAPLQHVVLIIGRSCLVGLSGPLIFFLLLLLSPRSSLSVFLSLFFPLPLPLPRPLPLSLSLSLSLVPFLLSY